MKKIVMAKDFPFCLIRILIVLNFNNLLLTKMKADFLAKNMRKQSHFSAFACINFISSQISFK